MKNFLDKLNFANWSLRHSTHQRKRANCEVETLVIKRNLYTHKSDMLL